MGRAYHEKIVDALPIVFILKEYLLYQLIFDQYISCKYRQSIVCFLLLQQQYQQQHKQQQQQHQQQHKQQH